ncbi:MAG: transposase [Ruegeria sp.]|uniref:transposase n=1 Tax=Ruegeria sp. TaxID=1879320 RepID=UPI00349EE0D5
MIHQSKKKSGVTSDLFWLTDAQMARLETLLCQVPRQATRRWSTRPKWHYILNRNGLRWRDTPREYGPHKTLHNRWTRWSDGASSSRSW